jgi:hypothetical protein
MLIRQVLAVPGNAALATLALGCAAVSLTCLTNACRALLGYARSRRALEA